MCASRHVPAVVLALLAVFCVRGCSTPNPGGDGNANTNGNVNSNTNANDNGGANVNDNGSNPPSPGFQAFTARGCGSCHPSQATDFSDSSVDDIVETLLDEKPHPGGAFGDMSEQEIDDVTDFLLAVMLGDDDLEGGGGDDNENDNGDENQNDNGQDEPESEAHVWFEQVWSDFDRSYSHFESKQVDWDAVRASYEPRFQADLDVNAFTEELGGMLGELRDLHVWLFDAAGQVVDVYSRTVAPNYPDFYPDGATQMGEYPLWHCWVDDSLAFISIETFEGERWEGLRTGEIDALFAAYAAAEGVIIDVRFNNGGDENVARAFASHLTESSYVYGYHRSKLSDPDHGAFDAFEEHRLDPSENARLLKPAACLIGQRNMSSAEWFVLMMRENPGGVLLVGDTTRGSSGFPQEFGLSNGIKYYIPSWEAFRADQATPIEDIGVPPTPGHAIPAAESFNETRDFVLERAVEALRG